MNPNAPTFNPNAAVFVPSGFTPAVQKETTPPPKKVVQPKKEQEVSSWEESEGKVEQITKPMQTVSIQEKTSFVPSEEQIKKELERVAAEEGVTTEELLKEEDEGATPLQEIEEDKREHLNIIFIGHVDAGKSTISGNVLVLTGQVDSRTIEKFQQEAKSMNRDSWFYAYVMDTNIEERQKGKTVEVGRASFETETKRYTILDAPGHKNYVPNMIGGAAQADVGVLVISARKGEFETGFNRGGQTREHTLLAKTLGVGRLIVVINKMDDPTVEWSKERYDEIVNQLVPFIKSVGYNVKTDVTFIPVSGMKGSNIKEPLSKEVCPWYEGQTLLGALDNLKALNRLVDFPLRIPILDKFRDRGTVGALGKVEAGVVVKGQQLAIYPNKAVLEVTSIVADESRNVKRAGPGENVKVSFKGIDEDCINRGFMICDPKKPIPCQAKFEAQVAILDLLPHKSVFSAGYNAIIHIHTAVEECTITLLIEQLDKKTGDVVQKRPKFVKNGAVVRCMIECAQPICLELFKDVQQLGRFTLRDEGKTIAIGKVTALAPKKKTGN